MTPQEQAEVEVICDCEQICIATVNETSLVWTCPNCGPQRDVDT